MEHVSLDVAEVDELLLHSNFAVNFALQDHVKHVALAVKIEDSGVLGHLDPLHDFANLLNAGLVLDHVAVGLLLDLARRLLALHFLGCARLLWVPCDVFLVHLLLILLQLLVLEIQISLDEVELVHEMHHELDVVFVAFERGLLED